jgi:hypothetical protein
LSFKEEAVCTSKILVNCTRLHGITSQKIVLFIATSVSTQVSQIYTELPDRKGHVRRMKEDSTKTDPSIEAKGEEKVRNTTEERT